MSTAQRVYLSGALQCVAVCCSVLQYVAVCCRVLPCVAVCCIYTVGIQHGHDIDGVVKAELYGVVRGA